MVHYVLGNLECKKQSLFWENSDITKDHLDGALALLETYQKLSATQENA